LAVRGKRLTRRATSKKAHLGLFEKRGNVLRFEYFQVSLNEDGAVVRFIGKAALAVNVNSSSDADAPLH
jgi:hypothetical protein